MSAVDVSEEVASHGSKQNMIEASDLRVDIDHGQTKDKNNEDGVGVGRDEGKDRETGTRVDHTFSNLGILALSELLGGMTYSLLSPFYTKEATRKGCSVTETGIVSVTLYPLLISRPSSPDVLSKSADTWEGVRLTR